MSCDMQKRGLPNIWTVKVKTRLHNWAGLPFVQSGQNHCYSYMQYEGLWWVARDLGIISICNSTTCKYSILIYTLSTLFTWHGSNDILQSLASEKVFFFPNPNPTGHYRLKLTKWNKNKLQNTPSFFLSIHCLG